MATRRSEQPQGGSTSDDSRFIAARFGEVKQEKIALDLAAHSRFSAAVEELSDAAVEELSDAIRVMEAESSAWSALLIATEGIPSAPRHAMMGLEDLAHRISASARRGCRPRRRRPSLTRRRPLRSQHDLVEGNGLATAAGASTRGAF